jgi:hypothetical protein
VLRAARSNRDALIQAEGAVIDHGEFEYLVPMEGGI